MQVKGISIVLPKVKGAAAFVGMKEIGNGLIDLGISVQYIWIYEIDNEEIIYDILLTHNLLGIDYIQSNFPSKKIVSIIDTPLNKFKRFKAIKNKCLILFCDTKFKTLVQELTDDNVSFGEWKSYNNAPYKGETTKLSERVYDIIFVGRIDKNENYSEGLSFKYRLLLKKLSKKFRYAGDKQIHELVRSYLGGSYLKKIIYRELLGNSEFSWGFYYKLSNSIRSKKREKVLIDLMGIKNLSILLCTDKYTVYKYSHKMNSNMKVEIMLPWAQVVEKMANSKICINIHPFHVDNTHERVCVAQSAGAIVISDPSTYLTKELEENKTGFIVSLEDDLEKQISSVLNNKYLDEIQTTALKRVQSHHSKKSRVQLLLNQLENWEKI